MGASPPFALVGLDHVVLRVIDLEAMLRFYRTVIGCTLERERRDLGLYQLRAGRSLIDLVTVDGPLGRSGGAAPGAEGRNLDHLCLTVRPFDEAVLRRHMAHHGVAVGAAGDRYGAEGEGWSIYIEDPEGNTVELKAARD